MDGTGITLTLTAEEQADILSALHELKRHAYDSRERDIRCANAEDAARHGRLARRCHNLIEKMQAAQNTQWHNGSLLACTTA